MRSELINQHKISTTQTGIGIATFRLVAQCLDQLNHSVPPPPNIMNKLTEIKGQSTALVSPTDIHKFNNRQEERIWYFK